MLGKISNISVVFLFFKKNCNLQEFPGKKNNKKIPKKKKTHTKKQTTTTTTKMINLFTGQFDPRVLTLKKFDLRVQNVPRSEFQYLRKSN